MIVALMFIAILQINPQTFSGLQRDANPWPLRYRCSAPSWSYEDPADQFVEFILTRERNET